jgi:hypothetical protein
MRLLRGNNTLRKVLDKSAGFCYPDTMMNKEMNMDLKPMNPADILASYVTGERAFNIALANVRNPNSLGNMIAESTKKYLKLTDEIERLEATLAAYDLEIVKIKVSKRIAKVPKYARGITK